MKESIESLVQFMQVQRDKQGNVDEVVLRLVALDALQSVAEVFMATDNLVAFKFGFAGISKRVFMCWADKQSTQWSGKPPPGLGLRLEEIFTASSPHNYEQQRFIAKTMTVKAKSLVGHPKVVHRDHLDASVRAASGPWFERWQAFERSKVFEATWPDVEAAPSSRPKM